MCPFHLALASEDVNGTRLRLVCIGTKGDWVFLRKEWQNPTESAAWRTSGDGGCPYKPGFAPLRHIPGCHEPKYILLDYCHVFHLGYGQDMAASSIILLSLLGHFGNERKLDNRLIAAYEKFDQWCRANHRTSAIDEFSKQSFGMGSLILMVFIYTYTVYIIFIHIYMPK
ncbi:unnamed protein product [Cladocopium goreaui]|uniref:Uncharacterized protein n=1 Tax=Cladocopium goreaui TaxID=2562237 RepID=A0A9P1DK90_9DINO|nr:unnamed protein product [Cladocopium goreaui]